MYRLATNLLQGVLDLVLAPTCVGCRGPISPAAIDRTVCPTCWARARPLPAPRCDRCWTPLPAVAGAVTPTCRQCPDLRPAIRAIRSAYLLDDTSRSLVHALKYRGWYAVAIAAARRMARIPWPPEVEQEVALVLPVPLSRVRARERGYNQAAILGTEFALLKGWKCEAEVLERARSAHSQTTLHPTERRANVAGAFEVSDERADRVAAQHVLLIDDVWTTGATALSCADALLSAGVRAVSVLTFARALPDLERNTRRVELARHP